MAGNVKVRAEAVPKIVGIDQGLEEGRAVLFMTPEGVEV